MATLKRHTICGSVYVLGGCNKDVDLMKGSQLFFFYLQISVQGKGWSRKIMNPYGCLTRVSTASHLDEEDIQGQHRAISSGRARGERLIGRSQSLRHQHTDGGQESEQGGSHPQQVDDDPVLQVVDHRRPRRCLERETGRREGSGRFWKEDEDCEITTRLSGGTRGNEEKWPDRCVIASR